MTSLFRALVLAAALMVLLTTVACGDGGDGGNGGDESTPAPRSTVAPTGAGQGGTTTPAPRSTVPPTSAGQGSETTPAPEPTFPPETPTGGAIEMGIDVDVTGNTANALGTVESCVRVDVPDASFDGVSDHTIDVYVKGDVQAPVAYDAWLTYAAVNDGCPAEGDAETGDDCFNSFDDDDDGKVNDGCPQVGAAAESGTQCDVDDKVDNDGDALVHVAAPSTDTLIKMPGAVDLGNESLPDSDGTFIAGVIYLEDKVGVAGDGVLMRLGLDIGGSGVVTLVLNPPPLSAYLSREGLHSVTRASAKLAINADCPP